MNARQTIVPLRFHSHGEPSGLVVNKIQCNYFLIFPGNSHACRNTS
jgi:hypothetical protein